MAEDEEPAPEPLSAEVEPMIEEPPEPEPSGEPLEPRDTVPEPPPPPPEPGTEPPGRARGRVHHPTEELSPPEPGSEELLPEPPLEEPSSAEHALPPETGEEEPAPQLYDFETDEDSIEEPRPAASRAGGCLRRPGSRRGAAAPRRGGGGERAIRGRAPLRSERRGRSPLRIAGVPRRGGLGHGRGGPLVREGPSEGLRLRGREVASGGGLPAGSGHREQPASPA